MSMDLTGLVFGRAWTFRQLCIVSAIFGLVMLLISYRLEGMSDLDFSFWGYLFGLLAFTGALSLMESHSEWSKFGYLLLHIALVGTSLLLKREVFVIFGAIGIFGYLSNEAYRHFRTSFAFPFVLSLIGIALIFLPMQYKRNETALQDRAAILLGRRAGAGSGRA